MKSHQGNLSQGDLNGYCKFQGFDGGVYLDLTQNDAYSWYCTGTGHSPTNLRVPDGLGVGTDTNMDNACIWKNKSPGIARMVNFSDPYSWECWQDTPA